MSSATPPPESPRPGRRKQALLALFALGLLALMALGLNLSLRSPLGDLLAPTKPSDAEARLNVLALCDSVQRFRDEHGDYITAGPTPRRVPRNGQPVPFPKEAAFQRLGFQPGEQVRFQYEVVVQEDPVGEPEVSCLARGDFDGDGQNAVYRVRLGANGMTTPLEVEREGE